MNSAITLENIKKSFGEREALKGVSLSVENGDIFGYLGSNGAGKTTTIRVLLDLLKPNSGKALILGMDNSLSDTRNHLGFVLEADGLYNNMSAEENLVFYSKIYGIPDNKNRIGRVLEMVGLKDRAKDRVGGFSKGMRQRLAIARALVHNPDVLILDEPMSGIDPSGQIEVRKILLSIVNEEKKTIFFSSHNLDEVQRLCNRIALIDRGEIILHGQLKELMKQGESNEVVIETAGNPSDDILDRIKQSTKLGLKKAKASQLVFDPQDGALVPDIVSFLSGLGVKIEGVKKKESSLEELYSSILKERGEA
jgi:ABC-2 type transport system ATP-binding protein